MAFEKISIWLTVLVAVLFFLNGQSLSQQCVSGPANDGDDDDDDVTVAKVCSERCDCCGCKNSLTCMTRCNESVVACLTVGCSNCNTVWLTISDPTQPITGNFHCPNPSYHGAGMVEGCRLGFECCDGQEHSRNEFGVQACAVANTWAEQCSWCSPL